MKPGRPGSLAISAILDTILSHSKRILTLDGSITSKRNPVWQQISQELGNKISARTVYIYVTCNRHKIRDKLLDASPILDTTINSNSENENDSQMRDSNHCGDKSDSNEMDMHTRSYTIEFTKSEFATFVVVKKRKCYSKCSQSYTYKDYKAFMPGVWEDIMTDKIIEKTKTTCGYNFKGHYLNENGTSGSFKAGCKCGGTLHGIIEMRDDEDVQVTCVMSKGNGKCGKRWLRGNRREKVAREIGTNSVHIYRSEKANSLMNPGDPEPSNLNSSAVLRRVKHEFRSKTLLDNDPILAIHKMKHSTPGAHVIRHIGLDPFYVHYWTRHQVDIYRRNAARATSCISIDATGSIIKKFSKNGIIPTNVIYLYEAVIRIDEGQFSVTQMLSESHNTNTIQFWLSEWIRSGAPPPKEVVTDGSRALMTAATKAFTCFSTIEQYADACMESTMPGCYIRLDNAHFMKGYASFFKEIGTPRRIKTFYMAAIGQLILARSIAEANRLIKALLFISKSETEGQHNEADTEAEKSKAFIRNLITGIDVPEYVDGQIGNSTIILNTDDDDDKDVVDEHANKKRNKWCILFEEIDTEVQMVVETQVGNRDNAHYMPAFTKRLSRDYILLPVWSNIVRDKFGYGRVPATSASSEGNFNLIKTHMLKSCTVPMRPDVFLEKHLNYLGGRLKIVEARMNQPSSLNTTRSEQSPLNGNHNTRTRPTAAQCVACLNGDMPSGGHKCVICNTSIHNLDGCSVPYEKSDEGYAQKRVCNMCYNSGSVNIITACQEKENWGGLNTSPKTVRHKKSNAKYFGENTRIIQDEIGWEGSRKKIIIIKNGSHDSLRTVDVDGVNIYAIQTCAFDSVYQVVLAALCERPNFENNVRKHRENKLYIMALDVLDMGLRSTSYKSRTKILYNSMNFPCQQQPDGSLVMNCETSAAQIVLALFRETPSFITTILCDKCGSNSTVKFILKTVTIAQITTPTMDIYNILDLGQRPCSLKDCDGTKTEKLIAFGPLIIFEMAINDENVKINLDAISKKITNPLKVDEKYHLVGIINYRQLQRRSFSNSQAAHYTALCLRDHQWVEYDDNKSKENNRRGTSEVIPKLIFYAME